MTGFLPPPRPVLSVLPPPEPPSQFMSSRRAEFGGSIRLILSGELDLAAGPRFVTDLKEVQDHSNRVLLDLRALTFIDCASLATLFAAASRAHREDMVLILLGPLGQVRRMLDLVGAPPNSSVLDHAGLGESRPPVAA